MFLVWLVFFAAIAVSIIVFLTAPALADRKLNIFPVPCRFFAHRGLHDLSRHIAENSLAAFRLAADNGYGIELDIRETQDHVLVVHHDPTLTRSCGDDRAVSSVSYEELRSLRLFGTREKVPSLDEVLRLVNGRVPLLIEIKSEVFSASFCRDILTTLTAYNGPYCIESFDPRVLRWFRINAPAVVRGQLAAKAEVKGMPFHTRVIRYMAANLMFNFLSRPDFIAYGYKTDANIFFRMTAAVFRPVLAAWTVRDAGSSVSLRQRYDIQIFEQFRPDRGAADQEEE